MNESQRSDLIEAICRLAPTWTGDATQLASRALREAGVSTGPTVRIDLLETATGWARQALEVRDRHQPQEAQRAPQEPQEPQEPRKANVPFTMPMDPKTVGRVVNALARRYRFSDGSVMPLGEYLENHPPAYRRHSVRLYARKKHQGCYARLQTPKHEYTVWYADGTGLDVPKLVWDAMQSIPERTSHDV